MCSSVVQTHRRWDELKACHHVAWLTREGVEGEVEVVQQREGARVAQGAVQRAGHGVTAEVQGDQLAEGQAIAPLAVDAAGNVVVGEQELCVDKRRANVSA